MLQRMCLRTDRHLRQVGDLACSIEIDFDPTQWGVESLRTRQRQAMHRDAMCGPEQHHAPDLFGNWSEQGVSAGGDGAGVDVAGVRRNQRLGA